MLNRCPCTILDSSNDLLLLLLGCAFLGRLTLCLVVSSARLTHNILLVPVAVLLLPIIVILRKAVK